MEGLCKWGPSKFTKKETGVSSGKPVETGKIYEMPDPTWELEHEFFINGTWSTEKVLTSNDAVNRNFATIRMLGE